jgi:aspartate oxidase
MPAVRFEKLRLVRLLRDDQGIRGAIGHEPGTGEAVLVAAKSVVLASGGVGGLFAHSTYPPDVSGGSYAMAWHAGAGLSGLEFIQFEPLVAVEPAEIRGYVIPTTLFGDGAFLRDAVGVRFLPEFRPQGEAGIGKEELVLAMAEMVRRGRAETSGAVWLDARTVPRTTLEAYPWLHGFLFKHGIDLSERMVALRPAAHTCLGGIEVDLDRAVFGVPGLFAAGEAGAGVHGAGRLAGGSGTEVLVSGARAGKAAARHAGPAPDACTALRLAEAMFPGAAEPDAPGPDHLRRLARAQELLSAAAGIWRHGDALSAALKELREAWQAAAAEGPVRAPASARLLLMDRLLVSGMVLAAALQREESRGAHQRTDFPRTDPSWARPVPLPWRSGIAFDEAWLKTEPLHLSG